MGCWWPHGVQVGQLGWRSRDLPILGSSGEPPSQLAPAAAAVAPPPRPNPRAPPARHAPPRPLPPRPRCCNSPLGRMTMLLTPRTEGAGAMAPRSSTNCTSMLYGMISNLRRQGNQSSVGVG